MGPSTAFQRFQAPEEMVNLILGVMVKKLPMILGHLPKNKRGGRGDGSGIETNGSLQKWEPAFKR